jgi:hypothetical protein
MSHIRKSVVFGAAILALLTLVPLASAQATPSVSVSDQAIINGTLVVDRVVSAGPGWIVIHAQADGRPGSILGFTPIPDGESTNVGVEIDASKATPTLYAMLHTDAGELGAWEFPNGPDVPVRVGEQVVTPPFDVTVGVGVANQEVVNGSVTVAKVYSAGQGWIVIHAQADGKPGPILGQSPVADGENVDVIVDINTAGVTPTLYAMLHTDAGELGAWEFPGGPDVPVKARDVVITPAFQVMGGAPATLPVSGGAPFPWTIVLVAAGALALLGGLGATLARRPR